MAKKATTRYVCNNCGALSTSYSGRCFQCGTWNSIQEQLSPEAVAGTIAAASVLEPESVQEAASSDQTRLHTGIAEVDTIFGGGLVAGSVNLIAGQPGIGKSTLLLQLANALSKSARVLYVSGEESMHQIGLRAHRLGATRSELQLVTSNSADNIAATIMEAGFDIVVVDSIQTVSCSAVASAAGSVAQITNATQMITHAAKHTDTAVILVGHVTKEGSIAGPKVLEHAVDVVLQLEGDRYGGFKILRSVKNRFGSTNETAIFEMVKQGLQIVVNPSAALLAERQVSDGSIVLATIEGSRPLLVEIQALVNKSSYGYPKRAVSGFDLNRLNLLIAMLERRTSLNLSEQDVYINIVGGIHIKEPAADLAICMAIASASRGFQLRKNAVVFGEVGLSGEVRHAPQTDKRLAESKKLGFDGAIGPKLHSNEKQPANYTSVPDVRTALNSFLEKDT